MANNGSTTSNNTSTKAVEYVAMEEAQEVRIKSGESNAEKPWKLKSFIKKRTSLEKVLLLLLLLVVLLCILLLVVFLVNRGEYLICRFLFN